MRPYLFASALCLALFGVDAVAGVARAGAPPSPVIDRASYEDKLRGMWLGSCIANWTGLQSEGRRQAPPFYTDADWPLAFDGLSMRYIVDQDPWLADDDTDLEYLYIDLLSEEPDNRLSGEQIATAWLTHVDPAFVWVSNARALALMNEGALPPGTCHPPANGGYLKIDAQLTTEMIGAMAPAMAWRALEMADLPILTTSRGHAAHSAQVFVVMHALASRVDPELTGREQAVWLVEQARRYVPDSSKTADIIDHVLADFLANPDPTDWERTRDLIFQRYQADAAANGFFFRGFTESSVNFATGIMCLLYGEMDYLESVRIGSLSGWDSDNPTATIGGLIGLVRGHDALVEELRVEFPGLEPSGAYDVERTRDNYPVPIDTFDAIVGRMCAVAEREVELAGGRVEPGVRWLVPPAPGESPVMLNPRWREHLRSARQDFKANAEFVNGSASVASAPPSPSTTFGRNVPAFFFNGLETDASGVEPAQSASQFYSSAGAAIGPGEEIVLEVRYPRPISGDRVRFIEGNHFGAPADPVDGGWFDTIGVEVRIGAAWQAVGVTPSEALDSAIPWQEIDLVFDGGALEVTGIRVRGVPGGADRFVTACEVDLLSAPVPLTPGALDTNADGWLNVEDLYSWWSVPVDLDADGVPGLGDAALVEAWIRWSQTTGIAVPPEAPTSP